MTNFRKFVSVVTVLLMAVFTSVQINAAKPMAPNKSVARQAQTSYILLADGFDKSEALVPIDVLRRADMSVKTVSVSKNDTVTSSDGFALSADITLDKFNPSEADWIIVPGGTPGSANLASVDNLSDLITEYYKAGGRVAAIGAAPALILYPTGILDGQDATCQHDLEEQCPKAHMMDRQVVSHPRLITADGAGAALPFAFAIVAATRGVDFANNLAKEMSGQVQ